MAKTRFSADEEKARTIQTDDQVILDHIAEQLAQDPATPQDVKDAITRRKTARDKKK